MLSVILLICLLPFDDKDPTAQHAEAFWKANVRKQQGKVTTFHTENIILFGSADAKLLESVGRAAEKSVLFAKKSIGYDKEPVKRENQQMYDRPNKWEGKLVVLVCKERHEFVDLFNMLKNAKPEAEEVKLYHHDKGRTYVLLGPAAGNRKLNYELLAVEQAGAATLSRRHDPLPRWLANAYGRMLAQRFDPKYFAPEKGRLPYLAEKLHARDIMMEENSAIPAGALLPLQTSLVEYLSQSPKLQEKWFTILDETAYRNGNLIDALQQLKIELDPISVAWKNSLTK